MIDIIFAILMLAAIFKGYRRGLIVAVFSIAAFIIGLAAALKLSAVTAHYLQQNVNISGKWLPFLSFTLVFLAVVFLINMGAKLLEKTFEMAMLGWANRIGGIVLFIFLYLIIYSVFLFYAAKVHLIGPAAIASSATYPYIQPLAPKVIGFIGSMVPVFKDLFTQLSNYFEGVSTKVAH